MALDDLAAKIDFTLAFAIVHEFPDAQRSFAEVARASKPGANLLLAEPFGHVDEEKFAAELSAATLSHFEVTARPAIRRSRAALLTKKSGGNATSGNIKQK